MDREPRDLRAGYCVMDFLIELEGEKIDSLTDDEKDKLHAAHIARRLGCEVLSVDPDMQRLLIDFIHALAQESEGSTA